MAFSEEWNKAYSQNTHLSVWPWSHLVSLVFRYSTIRNSDKPFRVLELGCGAGANIPFFLANEADYCAIEGSDEIVTRLKATYPQYKETIVVGDFTQQLPFEGKFDLVVDRGSITHNTTNDICKTFAMVNSILADNGVFIGTDWFSNFHSESTGGQPTDDQFTRSHFENGPFANLGNVHFSTKEHLLDLLSEFNLLHLDLLETKTLIPEERQASVWQFVASKGKL